jgi:hypothetical protein
MKKLMCILLAGCASTTFVHTKPVSGERVARPAHEVQLFFGTEPPKAYEQIGYFERAPSDYINDSAGDLANEMRRKAGYEGCDAVIVPAKADLERLAASSTEKARAQCVMFREGAVAVAKPAAAPVDDATACDGGKAEACIRIGIEAEQKKALVEAFQRFGKACEAPNQRGCTHKAILLMSGGEGVPKDETQALELFTKACVLDDAIACRYQGVMYVEGKGGVKKSALGGLGYLEKACTAKDGWACWRIAQVYRRGEGTSKDADKATAYEKNACANGFEAACGTK